MPYSQDAPVQRLFGERLTVPGSGGTKTVFNRYAGYDSIRVSVAAAARLGFAPKIGGLWIRSSAGVWLDLLAMPMATGTRVIDRGSTGLILNLLATSRLYIGFVKKVNDIFVDIGSTVNAVASTLTAENSDRVAPGGFTSLTITADGTAAGGATFAQDGNITFTVPAGRAWEPRRLSELFPGESAPSDNLFWLRLATSASFTAGTLLDQISGFIEDDGAGTDTGETAFLRTTADHPFTLGDEVGALQPIDQGAGGTTMDVTWLRH